MMRSAVLIYLAVLIFTAPVWGATVEDYATRVTDARQLTLSLIGSYSEGEIPDAGLELPAIEKVRQLIPATERIDWAGGSVQTSNEWLHAGFERLTKEDNASVRAGILYEIYERLGSIETKLAESQYLTEGSRTKDEDKQKLAQILARDEYEKPKKQEESLFQKWYTALMDWLSRAFPRPNIDPQAPEGLQSASYFLQWLVYLAVIAVIGFLIYRFAPGFAKHFKREPKPEKEDRVILGERVSANESAGDLFREAERFAAQGDLRSAIRKGYIAVLCELSDRRLIGLARHKTNRDYLRELRKKRELYSGMSGLTQSFESHWYGEKPSSEEDWEEFRSGYKQTIGSIK